MRYLLIASTFLLPLFGYADNHEWLTIEELSNQRIADIATGSRVAIEKSAATVTVITAADLRQMGARTIWDAIETVPGMAVHTNHQANQAVVVSRGISPYFTSPQIGLLINGVGVEARHSVTSFGAMDIPIAMIDRIEIIRGASSALHGANAVMGTINIKTKTAESIDTNAVGTRLSSGETVEVFSQGKVDLSGIDVSAVLYGKSTDGYRGLVERDAATGLDEQYGTNTSLAPSHSNNGYESYGLLINADAGGTSVNLLARKFYNWQTGMGLSQALDPYGRFEFDVVNFDIKNTHKLKDDWVLRSRVSMGYISQATDSDIVLMPPGTVGAYPDGMLGNPAFKEMTIGANVELNVYEFADHTVRIGTGYTYDDLFEVTDTVNYHPNLTPRGEMVDVSDTRDAFLPESLLKYYYLYVQDEWNIATNWQLVYGGRVDWFSDFNRTITPRVALVWATTDKMVNKLIYSEGFRIPSNSERFSQSNPVRIGNPSIQPENSYTLEWSLFNRPIVPLNYNLSVYYFNIDDYIQYNRTSMGIYQAENSGEVEGVGAEFSFGLHFARFSLRGSWSINHTQDENGDYISTNPLHDAYVRFSTRYRLPVEFAAQINFEHYNHRMSGDGRAPPDNIFTLDLITNKDFGNGFNLGLGVYNVSDEQVSHPSPAGSPLVNDIPVAERSVAFTINYQF